MPQVKEGDRQLVKQRWISFSARLGLALSCLILFSVAVFGQSSGGAISGIVTDPSGSVVPGAQVQATHTPTNSTYSTTATADGSYSIGSLPIGPYRVTVEAKGFKRSVTEISVLTATTTTLNVTLQVGATTQQVSVVATTAPVIQTSNSEIATVQERRTLMDLPSELGGNNGTVASGRRQITSFLFLTPGVTGNNFSHYTNGAPDLASEVIIDGLPYTQIETPGFIAQSSPPFESVQEFKAANSVYPPEYGRGFGVEIYTLKSGTNHFHGDLFEFLRNYHLDARGFFARERPPIHMNNFGGTIGGPIKKNKLFGFFAWDEIHIPAAPLSANYVTLPTMAMRNGDFTGLVDSSGNQIPIYDPATPGRPQFSCGGVLNMICQNRLSAVSQKVISYMPPPDLSTFPNNFLSRKTQGSTIDRVPEFKVDWQARSNMHFYGHRWWTAVPGSGVIQDFGAGQPLDSGFPSAGGWLGGWGVNFDWILSPHLINSLAFGHSTLIGGRGTDPRTNSPIAIPGTDASQPGWPAIHVAGMPEMGNSDQENNPRHAGITNFTDTMTWTHGKHEIKFGGEYWREHQREINTTKNGGGLGIYHFGNLETSAPGNPNTGSAIASFLIGAVDTSSRLLNPAAELRDWHSPYAAWWFQDKYRATQKLTLNLGLRYDLPIPLRDTLGGMSGLDLNLPNPGAGNLPGAYVFGVSKVVPPIHLAELGPRIGITYQLLSQTVIRAGYAINYAQGNATGLGARQFGGAYYEGYDPSQTLISPDSGITPAYYWDNGYPAYTLPVPDTSPTVANGGLADYYNSAADRMPEAQTWTLDIQHVLPYNVLIDAAYVGNRGEHLATGVENLNQVPIKYLSLGSELGQNVSCLAMGSTGPCPNAVAMGVQVPYSGFNGNINQALRPFPQYTTLSQNFQPFGNSRYDSLQLKVQKRFSQGLAFLVSYTMSKGISDTSQSGYASFNSGSLDTANRKLEYALQPFDATHNLVVSWVYELPFARGSHGLIGGIARGWEISGIARYQSGYPLGIGGGPSLPIFNGGNRPNRVPGVSEGGYSGAFDPATKKYVNINAFSEPAPYTLGNVSRYEPSLRGFPNEDWDLGFLKRTAVPQLGEAGSLEFRWEMYNAFNQVVFGNPSTNINDPTTFGIVNSQANLARQMQVGLKLIF